MFDYAPPGHKRELIRGYLDGRRLAEIAKPEAPLDAVSFLRQLPVWGLGVKLARA